MVISLIKIAVTIALAAITITLAVIGWVVAHKLTSKRNVDNNRRELITNCFIDVYHALGCLVAGCVAGRITSEVSDDLNKAFASIQLFGNDEQIELANKIANHISENRGLTKELGVLLESLRNQLRKDLNIPETQATIFHLNMSVGNDS